MYYRAGPLTLEAKTARFGNMVVCRAESDDGLVWNKPSLGLVASGGSKANNIVLDATWRTLVTQGMAASRGRGELLVGVGDCSFDRTRARIRGVDSLAIDGVVVLAPAWTRSIVDAVAAGDHALAGDRQRRLVRLLDALLALLPLFPACTAVLNAWGIPGSVAPRPLRRLTPEDREQLLALPACLVRPCRGRSPRGLPSLRPGGFCGRFTRAR